MAMLFLAAGCGSDSLDESYDAVMVDPVPEGVPEGGAMGQTMQFQPVNASGMAGEATITERGVESEVMVRLTGASADGTHPGHVHSGTCEAIGSVVQPLQELTTDTTGTGTMTATVAIPTATLSDGQHIIVYHETGGAPATCAPIPAHVM